ncbi:MAG: BlaI/MecI/CopY family transcriptional regulator [Candidatus Aenigmatarchaeota archaeon]
MNDVEKEIMKIMKEKQVSRKWEIFDEISKKKKISKKEFEKVLNQLLEKNWLVSIYGGNTTFALTQRGLRESKLK